jgi:hypothetical protein
MKSSEYNAPILAEKMINEVNKRLSHYKTNEVLILFGDDFRYMNAFSNY